MSERRVEHLNRLDSIEKVLGKLAEQQYQFASNQSIRKNGESWPRYFAKVFTIDRILLLTVLIYQFGGQVQTYKTQLQSLVEARAAVSDQQQALSEQVIVQRQITAAQGESVDRLMSETSRLSKVVGQLDDQMKLTVKRSELSAAVEGRLIPRLERIEKAVKFD